MFNWVDKNVENFYRAANLILPLFVFFLNDAYDFSCLYYSSSTISQGGP